MQIAIAAKSLGLGSRFHMVMPLMHRSRINGHMGCPCIKLRVAIQNVTNRAELELPYCDHLDRRLRPDSIRCYYSALES
jgi:hypothetical protein